MRILIAEDDSVTRKLLQVHLAKWHHEVMACSDGSDAWQILRGEDPPKLAILDWMMPGIDGVTLCREIRKLEKHPYTYVILLTSRSLKEDVVEGLEAGADDYIIKPFDVHELKVRVRAGTRIVKLQEDLMAALHASEFQASHDALTGLWNRRAILEKVQQELDRCKRDGTNLGLIIADVDHFKQVNDIYGHLAGDAVLRELAKRIDSSRRSYDAVGRYGGEEFVILLPGCDGDEAAAWAERLRAAVANIPLQTNEGELRCSMSFGASALDLSKDYDLNSLLQNADEALLLAKNRGRNRVELWRNADEKIRAPEARESAI
ncbi:MAG: diguanylate cyclase [Desulfomonilaceae bacterium]